MQEVTLFLALWALCATAVAAVIKNEKSRSGESFRDLSKAHNSALNRLASAESAMRWAEKIAAEQRKEIEAVHDAVDAAVKELATIGRCDAISSDRDGPATKRVDALARSFLREAAAIKGVVDEAKVPTFCTLSRTLATGEVRTNRYDFWLSERVRVLVDPKYEPRLLWH